MKRKVPKLIPDAPDPAPAPIVPKELETDLAILQQTPPPEEAFRPRVSKSKSVGYCAPCGCHLILPEGQDEVAVNCPHQSEMRLYRHGKKYLVDISGEGYFTSCEIDEHGQFKK